MSFSQNLTIVDETQTFANLSVSQNFFYLIKILKLYKSSDIVNHNAHRLYLIDFRFNTKPPQLL